MTFKKKEDEAVPTEGVALLAPGEVALRYVRADRGLGPTSVSSMEAGERYTLTWVKDLHVIRVDSRVDKLCPFWIPVSHLNMFR